ncbi:MAG: hypothetical protein JWM74_897, partial [Myxococcaceae bacterium]|nr:hypothetical protein [Myxococcaceae bacterium]
SPRLHAVQHDSPVAKAEGTNVAMPQTPRAERSRGEALAVGRARAASALDSVLTARTDAGDWSASNCAVASKLGVVEKQVREYRNGDKAIPIGALYAMPKSVAIELLAILTAEIEGR